MKTARPATFFCLITESEEISMPRLTHLHSDGKYVTEEINVSFNDRGVGGAAHRKASRI